MNENKITYYTLLKLKNKKATTGIVTSGRLYGKNIDEIKKQLLENNDEQCYGIAFKTTVKGVRIDSEAIKNAISDADDDIGGLADKINIIMNKWDRKINIYTQKNNEIVITQKMDFLNDNKELKKNPIYIKYQKNDKKYIYEPNTDIIPSINEGEAKSKYYIRIDNEYKTNLKLMNTLIAEGNKQFGIYLLEEKIKDTFKGLGSEIQKVKYESLKKQITQIKMKQLQREISILESTIIEKLKNSNSNKTIETQTNTVQQNVFESMGLNPLGPENELYKGLFNNLKI